MNRSSTKGPAAEGTKGATAIRLQEEAKRTAIQSEGSVSHLNPNRHSARARLQTRWYLFFRGECQMATLTASVKVKTKGSFLPQIPLWQLLPRHIRHRSSEPWYRSRSGETPSPRARVTALGPDELRPRERSPIRPASSAQLFPDAKLAYGLEKAKRSRNAWFCLRIVN